MDETLDSVVDSGSAFESSPSVPDSPSVPEPAPVVPVPEPAPDPEPVPSDPVPVLPSDSEPPPVDSSEPVEPLPPSSVGPPPSDSSEDLVSPGEDSTLGGEQLSGGDENQQPGEEVLGDDVQQPVPLPGGPVQGGFVSNLPGWMADQVYGLQTVPQNTPEELILDNVETFQLSPIEDSTGLKGVLLRILGPYDNIVTQYRYQQSSNQYYTYVNEVTPDYPWIASAVLFIALLVSLFGLLKRGMLWMK